MSIFNDVFVKKPGRSLFNLTHERKFSANFDYLYPFLVVDTVPGDTFKLWVEMLVRTAPLVAPIMHRVNVKVNYFFVPNRLLWNEWEDFITGVDQNVSYVTQDQQNPYFVNPVKPFIKASTVNTADPDLLKDGSLMDYLGFPTMRPDATLDTDTDFNIDLMPFYAYNKIYVDWFRNQNVEGGFEGAHSSGENQNGTAYFGLRRRMYEKDYFTSCLPFAQRGDAVPIPVDTNPSIVFDRTGTTYLKKTDGITASGSEGLKHLNGRIQNDSGLTNYNVDNSANLEIVSSVSGTINDLRLATRLQRWLEKNARVGGRYIEQILGHFGVKSSDARLQRAEYLGGYTLPIVVSDVEQNANTAGLNVSGSDTPQGHLSGKGTAYGSSKPIKCYCEEHGFIIGLMSILPRTTYQDGFPRMYRRSTRYDYYFPEFANLGEQDVLKSEVYFSLADHTQRSDDRLGFQERYCEYKYIPSSVHGEFKNNLQFWHLGRAFARQPALNKAFVQANTRNNIFAVEDENVADHFYVNLINNVSALRPMPKQAIPTL